MGALAAADITYTVKNFRRLSNSRVHNRIQLSLGDGTKTYPTGGIAITGGNAGCPNTIESLAVVDGGTSGYTFNFNTSTGKLQMYQVASHTHNLLLKNAAVADGTAARVNAGANLLGANTGSDITVTGSGANGGIVANAGVLDGEIASSTAPANLSLIVEVIGW